MASRTYPRRLQESQESEPRSSGDGNGPAWLIAGVEERHGLAQFGVGNVVAWVIARLGKHLRRT